MWLKDKINDFLKVKSVAATEVEGGNLEGKEVVSGALDYQQIHVVTYDGEKTPGEMGVPKTYIPDYRALRTRSWQAYYDSDIAQMVINKYVLWVVSGGLKVQSEPVKTVIEDSGINFDREKITKRLEASFTLFSKSERSDYSGVSNLNKIASEAKKNAIIGGDVLVILRLKKTGLNVQLVDGAHLTNPPELDSSKRIDNGIELDSKGGHVAYHIYDNKKGRVIRIKARDRFGRKMAYMVYGLRYRLDHHRGIPLTTIVLQRLKSIERYSEAAITGAEERAKVPFIIEHGVNSTGEDPLSSRVLKGANKTESNTSNSYKEAGLLGSKIAQTTNKLVYNMPVDSSMKAIDSKSELSVGGFLDSYINIVCSSLGIPPEVAKSMYDSTFSASRAAIGDWSHTLYTDRDDFANQFYGPIWSVWLDVRVLKGKINIPGYVDALLTKDIELLEAIRNYRFVGSRVPHIDPLKEVKAERLKLGALADHIPLTTVEQSTENVGDGDFDSNYNQFLNEIEKIEPKENTDGTRD